MECPVAGFQFQAGETCWARMKRDDPVTLRREPGNRHDARAIAVEWNGIRLGYVPREANFAIAQMLDRGERLEARIGRMQATSDPWKRIGLEVFAVSGTAPAPRPSPKRPWKCGSRCAGERSPPARGAPLAPIVDSGTQ